MSEAHPDTHFMKAALALAETGLGRVAPNPSVGCVIVKDGEIIASARTQDGGRPHAETTALELAGAKAKGATVYVTLEPCFKSDGPSCALALIAAGVKKVVIGCTDENAAIKGKGVAALRVAGIEVVQNCLDEECRTLNKGFFFTKTRSRPLITLKTAISLDSKIATGTGHSQWITGPAARARGHLERARHDAILTGINTVLADDPLMTTRVDGVDHKSLRIILDANLKFPSTAHMLDTKDRGEIIVFTSEKARAVNQVLLEDKGVRIVTVPMFEEDKLSLPFVLEALANEGVTRLMVEAGQGVFTSFLKDRLWDYLLVFRAPFLIGTDGKDAFGELGIDTLDQARRLKLLTRETHDNDLLEIYEQA